MCGSTLLKVDDSYSEMGAGSILYNYFTLKGEYFNIEHDKSILKSEPDAAWVCLVLIRQA